MTKNTGRHRRVELEVDQDVSGWFQTGNQLRGEPCACKPETGLTYWSKVVLSSWVGVGIGLTANTMWWYFRVLWS